MSGMIVGIGALVVAILGAVAAAFKLGATTSKADAKERDREKADSIRDDFERHLDQRVRDMDGRGYRD